MCYMPPINIIKFFIEFVIAYNLTNAIDIFRPNTQNYKIPLLHIFAEAF